MLESDTKMNEDGATLIQKMIPFMTKKRKSILTVSDTSIALKWIQSIYKHNGKHIRMTSADSLTINEIGEKETNVILVSREEEFKQLSGILENNQ